MASKRSVSRHSTLSDYLVRRTSKGNEEDGELVDHVELGVVVERPNSMSEGHERPVSSASSYTRSMLREPTKEYVHDYQMAGFLSRMTFWYCRRFVKHAYVHEVEPEELWNLKTSEGAEHLSSKLALAWEEEVRKHPEKPKLYRAIRGVFFWQYFVAFAHKMGWLVAVTATNTVLIVQLLNLLDRAGRGEEPVVYWGSLEVPYKGFIYVALFCVGEMFRSLFVNQHWAKACITGIDLRGALISLLFKKLTRLRKTEAMGQVLNMVGNDCERTRDCCVYGVFIVSTPITLITIIGMGLWVLGPAILSGFAVLVLSVPVQTMIAKKTSKLRRESVVIGDARVKLMNEILKAAQIIKLYAWEDSFMSKVSDVRAREMSKIRKTAYTKAVNSAFSQIVPILTSLVTFIFHTVVLGNILTPAQAFATLAIFNVSRFPLNVLALSVRFAAEAIVSFERIGAFLALEELDPETEVTRRVADDPGEKVVVSLVDASFAWSGESSTLLRVGDLSIQRGTLTMIIGSVASGKTSLLNGALLGEMKKVSGESFLRGSVAFVSQTPWIFNATVQDNILLGKEYDREKFAQAIFYSGMEQDLLALPSGKNTEIGERGITISGGQRARLSLARAIYADCDILILDSVLAAVDAHVSAFLWEKCIRGLLLDKTVLLATHNVHHLPEADMIVIMQDMKLAKYGTFDELVAEEEWKAMITKDETPTDDESEVDNDNSAIKEKVFQSNDSTGSAEENIDGPVRNGRLIVKEDRTVGAVSMNTVRTFVVNAGGPCLLLLGFSLFWVSEGSKFASDAWLTFWSQPNDTWPDYAYAVVYGVLGLLVACFMAIRGIFFAKLALRAAQGLHDQAFLSVMEARMDFLQVTPLGRIIARFSSDMDKVDVLLVDIAEMALALMVRVFFSIVIISIILPAFLVVIPIIALVYYRLLNYFRRVVRQLKRIDNISRSPLLSQFQSIAQGLTSARTYQILPSSIEKNIVLVDETSKAYLSFYMSNRYIAINLDMITTLIVTVCAFMCVLFSSKISPGLAGLALTSALQTSGIFQYATRQT